MFSSKKSKKQDEKSVSVTESRHVAQIGQNLTVHSTFQQQRSQSVYVEHEETHRGFTSSGSITSLPALHIGNLSITNDNSWKPSSSLSNLGNSRTDARPIPSGGNINLNYQSPYRNNSPVNRSYRANKTTPAISVSVPKSAPPPIVKATPPLKKLVVKKTGKLYDDDDKIPTYKTSSKNRGEVLIINNIMFEGEHERKGAKVDHERLEDLFKQMGFKVTLKKDLKEKEMRAQIDSFSKKSSLKSADMTIVVIMSHGTKSKIYGCTEVYGLDDKGLPVEDVLQYFSGEKCKNMLNKPKIFIFQCCRGANEQDEIQSDAVPIKPRPLADMLLAYSTLPGFVSYRDPKMGTLYIQTICDVFSQHAHEYHIEELLKIVDVQLSNLAGKPQTSSYESRGFKRCYLHPK